MKEKIKMFISKHFGSLQDVVFSVLLCCSLMLNILLYLSLSDLIFDKIILGTVAGCIQFLEVYLLQKMKRYWIEKCSDENFNSIINFFNTILYKRAPAILFTALYLCVTSLSIGAAYSFSLRSIYNASIKQEVLLNNEEDIKIKEESLKSKDLEIASLETLRDTPRVSSTVDTNLELINDYNDKIITSEKRVTDYNDSLLDIRKQILNLEEEDGDIYQSLKNKEKSILSNISFEQKNVADYKAKKNKLLSEDNVNINKVKKEQEEAQRQYELYNSKIEAIRKEKILINQEIKKLKQEDKDNLKRLNKNQYQLVAENLTQIIYLKENKTEDNKVTEEQVRAVLLGIFSIMIEVGLLLTSRKEEVKIEKQKTFKKRPSVKLDNKIKIVETKEEPIVETKEEPIVETKEEPIVETKEEPIVETKKEPIIETKKEPIVETKEEPEIITSVAEDIEKIKTEEEPKKEKPIKIMSLEKEIEKMLNEKPTTVIRARA